MLYFFSVVLGSVFVMIIAQAGSTGDVKLEWHEDAWITDKDDPKTASTTQNWIGNAVIGMIIVAICVWAFSGLFSGEEVRRFSRKSFWIAFVIGWFSGALYLILQFLDKTSDYSNPPSSHEFGMGWIGIVLFFLPFGILLLALLIKVIKWSIFKMEENLAIHSKKKPAMDSAERTGYKKYSEVHQLKSTSAYDYRPEPRVVLVNKREICGICRQEIANDLFKCPKCSASFHEAHLAEWVKTKGQCPVCRVSLQLR